MIRAARALETTLVLACDAEMPQLDFAVGAGQRKGARRDLRIVVASR